MPRIELMAWQPVQRRWIKKYRGKQYVISCHQLGTAETQAASRSAANDWWQLRKVSIDRERFGANGSRQNWQALSEALFKTSDIAKRNGNLSQLAAVETEQSIISHCVKGLSDFPESLYEPPASESAIETARLDRLAVLESRRQRALAVVTGKLPDAAAIDIATLPRATKQKTLRETIDKFLSGKMDKVNIGELSPGRYDALDRFTKHFENFLTKSLGKPSAADIATDDIDGSTLPDFLAYAKTWQQDHKLSDAFTQNMFAVAKQLIQFAYNRGYLENLPRSFSDRELKVTIERPKPVALSVAVTKLLLAWKNDKLRLYVLLALNCAMTQKDISDLLNSEVDWKEGRIMRKRSKTSTCENTPTVNYKLWPETFRLLCQFRNTDKSPSAKVLVNRNGKPLLSVSWKAKCQKSGRHKGEPILDGNGKPRMRLCRSDSVRNLFQRQAKKMELKPKFKQLRKTGSTTLKGLGADRDLRNEYLGHSLRNIRERDYEGDSPEFQARFDAAIANLGKELGLVE